MTAYQAPSFEWKELARGIYAFLQTPSFGVSNAGLIVGKNDAIVIDSLDNKYMVENFIGKIKEATDKPVRYVFNTHSHPDHIFTNHFFTDATAITSHLNRTQTLNKSKMSLDKLPVGPGKTNHDGSKFTPQKLSFEGTLKLHDGEREIQMIDMGMGHSFSDSVVYLPEEKILFTGDLLMIGMHPALGVERVGGSYNIIKILDTLVGMDVETYVPGHGKLILNRQEALKTTREFIEFYTTVRDEGRNCFNKGMTCNEAFEQLDWNRFKKWGSKEDLTVIKINLTTAWTEFKGEPPSDKLMQTGMP